MSGTRRMLRHSVGFGCVRSRMAFAPMPWPATSLGVGSGCAARSGYGRGGNRRWPGGCFRANLGLRAVATHPVAARRPRLPLLPPNPRGGRGRSNSPAQSARHRSWNRRGEPVSVLTSGCARLSVGASPRAAPALPLHSLEPGLCAGGRTVAVIGTPLSKAYPAENAASQERIWREHLLLTLFVKARPCSGRTFRSEIG